MPTSYPTIPAAKAVVNIHSSISITGDARVSSTAVWNALVDTSTWPRWNPFVPRVTIRAQPTSSAEEHASSRDSRAAKEELSPILQLGTKMTFHFDMDAESSFSSSASSSKDPSTLQKMPLIVTVFDPPDPATRKKGRVVWVADSSAQGGYSPWLLRTERTHEIYDEDANDDAGVRNVQVKTWEHQTGPLASGVRWLYGQRLQVLFEDWVKNLKGFVEREEGIQ